MNSTPVQGGFQAWKKPYFRIPGCMWADYSGPVLCRQSNPGSTADHCESRLSPATKSNTKYWSSYWSNDRAIERPLIEYCCRVTSSARPHAYVHLSHLLSDPSPSASLWRERATLCPYGTLNRVRRSITVPPTQTFRRVTRVTRNIHGYHEWIGSQTLYVN